MSAENDIDKLTQDWIDALERKDAKACAELYTKDGWILSSYGDKAHGRESIENTHQEWIDANEKNKNISIIELSVVNDLACGIVTYSGDYDNEDGSVYTEAGKCVNVYKRQADGTWKFHISSLTSDTPPPAQ
jgi:uncharacterized protein (TIGR02246 family)